MVITAKWMSFSRLCLIVVGAISLICAYDIRYAHSDPPSTPPPAVCPSTPTPAPVAGNNCQNTPTPCTDPTPPSFTSAALASSQSVYCHGDPISVTLQYGSGCCSNNPINAGSVTITITPSPGEYSANEYTLNGSAAIPGCSSTSYSGISISNSFTVMKVEIAEAGGAVIGSTTSATVAVRDAFEAKVSPAGLGGLTYQWKIGGSTTPAASTAIKTYSHAGIQGPHAPQNLVAGDLQAATLDLFWTNSGAVDLTLEVTKDSHTCSKTISVNRSHNGDPNRNIYARSSPDPDHNPNGSGGFYQIRVEHGTWHSNNDGGKGSAAYGGAAFFTFHRNAILASEAWRATFNVTPQQVPLEEPAGHVKPSYLKVLGGTDPSPVYGYVRLGECADTEEAGDITVGNWHDGGHMAFNGDMASVTNAPSSANNRFWAWHGTVDIVRAAVSPVRSPIVGTPTLTRNTFLGFTTSTTVTITFVYPTSVNAPAANTKQVTAAALTVNGTAATSISTSDNLTFIFDIADPGAGTPVTLVLTGTAGFYGGTWTGTMP